MRVELSRAARKELDKLNQPVWGRMKKALKKLELEPPEGDIKKLTGADGYRVRVGDYRIVFDIVSVTEIGDDGKEGETQVVSVESVLPRGEVYKGKGAVQ